MKGIGWKWLLIMCAYYECAAQIDDRMVIQKYDTYQSKWPNVSIYMVFNQDKYSPGDTAYFKAYFLDEELKGIPGRQLLELNLIGQKRTSMVHFMFSVENGIGFNQIAIPDTLSAGIYLVTVTSTWMMNFDPPPVFEQEVIVVRENQVIKDASPKLFAAVEGGHLLNDVPARVVLFSSVPGTTVGIKEDNGKEVITGVTDKSGLYTLEFTPSFGIGYVAGMTGLDKSISLPIVEKDGGTLTIAPYQDGVHYSVQTILPPKSDHRINKLMLVATAAGKVVYIESLRPSSPRTASVEIPIADMPPGIIQLSLLDEIGKELASRNVYHAMRPAVIASIHVAKTEIERREPVSLEISLQDKAGHPVSGNFSLSVTNDHLFASEKISFSDELYLTPCVGRELMEGMSLSELEHEMDNLMILTTTPLPWQRILSDSQVNPRFDFTHELKWKGYAYAMETGKPLPAMSMIMFYLQGAKLQYSSYTWQDGSFYLSIFDVIGTDEFFWLAESSRGHRKSNVKIEWEKAGIELLAAPPSHESDEEDLYGLFASKKLLIDRSFGFFTSPDTDLIKKKPSLNNTFEDLIHGPDLTINIQDYVLFPTMEELLKEVVPSLRYRQAGGKDIVRVTIPEPMVPEEDPVYIIDGIATDNTSFFLSLKPTDLLSIGIVNEPKKLKPLGLLGKNGLVIVHTKAGNVREPIVDSARIIKGINKVVPFHALDYTSDRNRRLPDFKSTIYWSPNISTGADGKATIQFFSTDDLGPLRIRVDGLTTDGSPFSATGNIEVVTGRFKEE